MEPVSRAVASSRQWPQERSRPSASASHATRRHARPAPRAGCSSRSQNISAIWASPRLTSCSSASMLSRTTRGAREHRLPVGQLDRPPEPPRACLAVRLAGRRLDPVEQAIEGVGRSGWSKRASGHMPRSSRSRGPRPASGGQRLGVELPFDAGQPPRERHRGSALSAPAAPPRPLVPSRAASRVARRASMLAGLEESRRRRGGRDEDAQSGRRPLSCPRASVTTISRRRRMPSIVSSPWRS